MVPPEIMRDLRVVADNGCNPMHSFLRNMESNQCCSRKSHVPGFKDGGYPPHNTVVIKPFQPLKQYLLGNSQALCKYSKRPGYQRDIVLEGVKNVQIRSIMQSRIRHVPASRGSNGHHGSSAQISPLRPSGGASPSHQRAETASAPWYARALHPPQMVLNWHLPHFPERRSGSRRFVKILELFHISANGTVRTLPALTGRYGQGVTSPFA